MNEKTILDVSEIDDLIVSLLRDKYFLSLYNDQSKYEGLAKNEILNELNSSKVNIHDIDLRLEHLLIEDVIKINLNGRYESNP